MSRKERPREAVSAEAGSSTHSSTAESGIEVELDVEEPAALGVDATNLLFRVARESLRNIVEHASATRVRVCVECGMPIAEHRDWCSILRGQKEMEAKSKTA